MMWSSLLEATNKCAFAKAFVWSRNRTSIFAYSHVNTSPGLQLNHHAPQNPARISGHRSQSGARMELRYNLGSSVQDTVTAWLLCYQSGFWTTTARLLTVLMGAMRQGELEVSKCIDTLKEVVKELESYAPPRSTDEEQHMRQVDAVHERLADIYW